MFRNSHRFVNYLPGAFLEYPLDREMLAALWVYADFSDRAEYHYSGELPVKILFFADANAFDEIPADAELYTVTDGDTLRELAKKYYGMGTKWGILYEANKAVISNPGMIYISQTLLLPVT